MNLAGERQSESLKEPLPLGHATDITERKQAQKQLRESEERFRVIYPGPEEPIS
jgi:PAS domain-containing protein